MNPDPQGPPEPMRTGSLEPERVRPPGCPNCQPDEEPGCGGTPGKPGRIAVGYPAHLGESARHEYCPGCPDCADEEPICGAVEPGGAKCGRKPGHDKEHEVRIGANAFRWPRAYGRVEAERDAASAQLTHQREALSFAYRLLSAMNHRGMGEACGEDACTLCLIEAGLEAALTLSDPSGEGEA